MTCIISPSRHYNDDLLWITLQEILKWLFCFHAHKLQIGLLRRWPNRLDPFIVINKQSFFFLIPHSVSFGIKGWEGHYIWFVLERCYEIHSVCGMWHNVYSQWFQIASPNHFRRICMLLNGKSLMYMPSLKLSHWMIVE